MSVATGREYGLFIDGETVEPAPARSRDLVEPATGETLRRGPRWPARRTSTARSTPPAPRSTAPWGKTPPTERSRLLHALADAIVANRKELAELEARNVGKAISSVKAEIAGAVENFRFYASAIGSIGGRSNPIGGSLLFYSLKEPVGVAGQIVPWNYPLLMTTWKLAPALAAGCAVVLKPDPQTPLTALRLAELAAEVGFPAGASTSSRATGRRRAPTSSAIRASTRSPSPARRRPAARSCGSAPSRSSALTLELGGKSPNLVFADADLDDAIPSSRLVDLLRRRPELRGALADARRASRSTTRSCREFAELAQERASATRSTPRRRSAR